MDDPAVILETGSTRSTGQELPLQIWNPDVRHRDHNSLLSALDKYGSQPHFLTSILLMSSHPHLLSKVASFTLSY
jgi:hypothetical protein